MCTHRIDQRLDNDGRWREDRGGGRNGIVGTGARHRKWDDGCDGYGRWGGNDDGDCRWQWRWWPAGGECDGGADVDGEGEGVCVSETRWLGFREVEGVSPRTVDRTIAQDCR